MKNTNDLYICVEGIDGCGKTTVVNKLMTIYPDAVVTREPGSKDKICTVLRNLIFNTEVDDETALYLFIADRVRHMKTIVIPTLESNKMIISDRCFLSTLAYQAKFGIDYLLSIHSQITMVDPDIIFIIDTDPKVAYERLRLRNEAHDIRTYYMLKRLRQNFLNMQNYFPELIEVIDGNKPIDDIVNNINKVIKQYTNIVNNIAVVQ